MKLIASGKFDLEIARARVAICFGDKDTSTRGSLKYDVLQIGDRSQ
jgi:hypothetical protein